MSIYCQFDTDEQRQFASNQGWSDIIAWAETLDETQFPEIVHLCDNGYEVQLDALEQQLQEAVQIVPPPENVLPTIEGLLDALAVRGAADVVFITNGMTPDDGQEDGAAPPPDA